MASSAPDESHDRRKKPRIPRRLPVRFGTEARMCGGTAVDISDGGLRVECPETFPQNSILQVFVQFPRHSVRLRARVAWLGSAGEGASPRMGLAFTQPEPTLVRAYKEWQAEVKLAAVEAAGGQPADATPAVSATSTGATSTGASAKKAATGAPEPAAAGPPAAPDPKGPVRRRLETRQGNSYDVLIERDGAEWRLTIVQLPLQIGVGAPDLEKGFSTYAETETALREFIRTH